MGPIFKCYNFYGSDLNVLGDWARLTNWCDTAFGRRACVFCISMQRFGVMSNLEIPLKLALKVSWMTSLFVFYVPRSRYGLRVLSLDEYAFLPLMPSLFQTAKSLSQK